MNCDYRGIPINNWSELVRERKERNIKSNRRRKIKNFIGVCKLAFMLILVAGMFLAVYFRDTAFTRDVPSKDKVIENLSTSVVSGEKAKKLREILSNKDNYPVQLLDLINKNPETIDFVYDYPKNKDRIFDIDIRE